LLPLARVVIPGRLVGEDQGRRVDQCTRHGDELLLAARELPREEIFLRNDSEPVRRVGNERVALTLLDVAVRQRDIEVLRHREVVEQVILLKHEPDVLLVERHAVLGLHLVHQVVQEAVLAGPVAVEHAEHGEQRGLPRPGGAHDGDELASGDVERDLPQDEQAAVALGDGLVEVLELDHSYLNATMGSTRAARRAGNQPASRATALNNAIATTYATGSVGATPNSSPRSTRVSTSAAMKPSANPIMAKRSGPPTTNRCTAAGSAPSAMRAGDPPALRREAYHGILDCERARLVQRSGDHVRDDADHVVNRWPRASRLDPFPDRVLTRPEPPRERPADDHRAARRFVVVRLGEAPPGEQRNSQRFQITRRRGRHAGTSGYALATDALVHR